MPIASKLSMLAAVPALSLSLGIAAQPAPEGPPARPGAENNILENEMPPELEDAVRKGLAALAEEQREDGSFGGQRYGSNAGITAIAALAFMSDGHVPGRGEYAGVVERALDFILANMNENGFIAKDTSHGPMYGHGFATLFLAEVYGMTPGGPDTELGRRVHDALRRACRLIVQSQNNEGGWRYNPVPYDADISVTICQIMALRAARNASIDVPGVKNCIDRAVEYVRACQNADGGFSYQRTRGRSAWPRSAAGVASLQYAGIYEDDAIDRGLSYLFDNAMPGGGAASEAHYFYGQYYSVQCMYLEGGDAWARWWPAVRREILSRQSENGLWSDASAGSAYGTGMALIVLQIPKRYLPIFQK